MAQLHSLIALQQFMKGLGEEMDEAEVVWNIEKKKETKRKKEHLSHGKYKNRVFSSFTSLLLTCRGIYRLGRLFNCDYSYSFSYMIVGVLVLNFARLMMFRLVFSLAPGSNNILEKPRNTICFLSSPLHLEHLS